MGDRVLAKRIENRAICHYKSASRVTVANNRPFEVFICYKRASGEDFAEHLKTGLDELGVHAFLDSKDVSKRFKATDEWANAIDMAITESTVFILIITAGFDSSPEISRELTLARKKGKFFVYLRHETLKANLKVALKNEELNLEKQQQITFSNKNDLLRKAYSALVEEQ